MLKYEIVSFIFYLSTFNLQELKVRKPLKYFWIVTAAKPFLYLSALGISETILNLR